MNNDRNEDNDYRRINRKREHEDRGGGKMVGRDKLTFSRHPLVVNNEPRLTFQQINYHLDHTFYSVLLVTTCKNVVIYNVTVERLTMPIYWNVRRGGSKGSMSFTTSDV